MGAGEREENDGRARVEREVEKGKGLLSAAPVLTLFSQHSVPVTLERAGKGLSLHKTQNYLFKPLLQRTGGCEEKMTA